MHFTFIFTYEQLNGTNAVQHLSTENDTITMCKAGGVAQW